MTQDLRSDVNARSEVDNATGNEEQASSGFLSAIRRRLRWVTPLFFLTVILPSIFAIVYYGFLANDIYVSESRFVVRSPNKANISPLGAVLGSTIGGASDESNTVTEFLQSRSALKEINGDNLVTKAYGSKDIFFWDRFGGFFDDTNEQLYQYFQDKLLVNQGATTQVTRLTVEAYSPLDAQKINERLLQRSEALVNILSERARNDTITLAQRDVDDAKAQAQNAAVALASYRNKQRIIDPKEQASAQLLMISKLQDELIASRTQLRQLQTYTPRASQIPFLRTQVRALQSEIDDQMAQIAGGSQSLAAASVKYQELQLNADFSNKQLGIAMASLQEAKDESERKQAYVDRIASPSLSDYPSAPKRIRSIFATIILGFLVWGVLSMLIVGIREHRD